MSTFRLDRFEITVGRFQAFVEAYPENKPLEGVRAHTLIAGSGWNMNWDRILPADQEALKTAVKCNGHTWMDAVKENENLPMNCVSWYEALAFCAWDGGRLPTEAEWNYAAADGVEQRVYPWSTPSNDLMIDNTYAVYGNVSLLAVGSKSPKGDQDHWKLADLAGTVWEWNLDWYASAYPKPCVDCANTQTASYRVLRGGSVADYASKLLSSYRYNVTPRVSTS